MSGKVIVCDMGSWTEKDYQESLKAALASGRPLCKGAPWMTRQCDGMPDASGYCFWHERLAPTP
jgi:hypothetical protein